ncbi:hypothetical protein AMS68_003061 [Peltaster fructicola]|uniref:Sister chromatid cohesion protein DCC1 n=1 Tax=Peltaster fructicola TaxID=286661 RepID=A0A6H0XS32_9PEZI|nr:hypothetical protein AMS68_003061 [Peltaster fructicola]
MREATGFPSERDTSGQQFSATRFATPLKASVERSSSLESTCTASAKAGTERSATISTTSTRLTNISAPTVPSSTSEDPCHASANRPLQSFEPFSGTIQQQRIEQLTITVEQLDQVISALVRAPLITSSLQNQHLSFATSQQTSGIFNLSNKQFITRTAQEFAPDLHLFNGRSGGVSMIDTGTADGAVLYTSAICDTNSLKSGDRIQIDLPDDLPSAVRLEYLPPNSNGMSSKVTLQSIHAVYARRTDSLSHHLSIEEDLTHAFTKAALAELARISSVPVDDIKIVDDVATAFNKNSVDWSVIADALLASGESVDLVDQTLMEIRSLDATLCAMQTLTLLSEISRLKSCNRNFLVLQLVRDNESGKVEKTTVPYWSQSIWSSFDARKADVDVLKVAKDFIHSVVKAVYPCPYMLEEFAISDASGFTKIFRCLPLYDDGGKTPKAWAVFIEPGAKTTLIRKAYRHQSNE